MTLEKLPYGYADLEPYIDTHTLGVHYNYHSKNYLNKLKNLLKENGIKENIDFDILISKIAIGEVKNKDDILFNLGGVINHNLYFKSISPRPTKPNNLLMEMINNSFVSYDDFKSEFKKFALSLKGSGYTYLLLDGTSLKIVNTKNQDCPIFYGLTPLLTLDMWEHAYYINYENKKDLYIDKFLEIANFKDANEIIDRLK